MSIREVTQDNYQEFIKEGFTILDVYGTHCGPCKMLAKVLEEISFEYPFINILKINSDENKEFTKEYKITGVPKVFFYKDGEIVDSFVGFMPAQKILEKAQPYMY